MTILLVYKDEISWDYIVLKKWREISLMGRLLRLWICLFYLRKNEQNNFFFYWNWRKFRHLKTVTFLHVANFFLTFSYKTYLCQYIFRINIYSIWWDVRQKINGNFIFIVEKYDTSYSSEFRVAFYKVGQYYHASSLNNKSALFWVKNTSITKFRKRYF